MQATLIFVSFLVGASFAQVPPGPHNPVSYENAWPEKTIIGGSLAEPGEFPYQAYLVSSRFWGLIQSGCGGSLIQPTWVLTASHCIHRTQSTVVHLGSTNINQMPYKERAAFRKMHEMYDPNTLENDVALLRLPRAAEGENIALVALPPMDIGSLADEMATVSGYGLTQNNGEGSEDLKKAVVNIITNEQCSESFPNLIQNSTLCTFYTMEPASACQGDSGGPLSYNSTEGTVLVGVVSFGSSRGCDSAPVAFARVSSFLDWINDTMAMNMA